VRIYRASKILSLAVEDAMFERPKDFDLAAAWSEAMQRFERDLRPGTATLRATPAGLKRLARLGAYAAEAVKAAGKPDRAGLTTLRLPTETLEQAALALLGVGPEVEVVEPRALRQRVARLAKEVARQHA
jgi:predicted DNA-binding transcriptional regulator YafY